MATVSGVCGSPSAKDENNQIRLLVIGDVVASKEQITTPDESSVQLELSTGETVEIPPETTIEDFNEKTITENKDVNIVPKGSGGQPQTLGEGSDDPNANNFGNLQTLAGSGFDTKNIKNKNLKDDEKEELPPIFILANDDLAVFDDTGTMITASVNLLDNDLAQLGEPFILTDVGIPALSGYGTSFPEFTITKLLMMPLTMPTLMNVAVSFTFEVLPPFDSSLLAMPPLKVDGTIEFTSDGIFRFVTNNSFEFIPDGFTLTLTFPYTITTVNSGSDAMGFFVLTIGGTDNKDVFVGEDADDNAFTGADDDVLIGNKGNDTLNGGSGDDVLLGGEGDDVIIPGTGDNIYDGGMGFDIVDYTGTGGVIDIDVTGGVVTRVDGVDTFTVSSIEAFLLSPNDSFVLMSSNRALNDGLEFDGSLSSNDTVSYEQISDAMGINIDLSIMIAQDTTPGIGTSFQTFIDFENIIATDFNDNITGSDEDNIITAGGGNDVIDGKAGMDNLIVSNSNPIDYDYAFVAVLSGDTQFTMTDLVGSDGVDTIVRMETIQFTGGPLMTLLLGDNAANNLIGVPCQDDLILGFADNDTLFGDTDMDLNAMASDDFIDGGSGADEIYGDAGGILDGVLGGNDTILGGTEDDTIYGDAATANASTGGDDSIFGGAGNDVIHGDVGAGSITGGNDTIMGGTGNDTLYGDSDSVSGGTGGNDELTGGLGDDIIYGDSKQVIGTTGTDTAFYADSNPLNFAYSIVTDGTNTGVGITDTAPGIAGDEGSDELYGIEIINFQGTNFNLITGDVNNNVFDGAVTGPAGDNDLILGFGGRDRVEYKTGNAVIVNLLAGTATGNGMDFLVEIEDVLGSDLADNITGDDNDNQLEGQMGDDTLVGGMGLDSLFGNEDNDTLQGGAGNDELSGGSGNDVLEGGADDDTITGDMGTDTVVVSGLNVLTYTFNFVAGDLEIDGTANGDGIDTVMIDVEILRLGGIGGGTEFTLLIGTNGNDVLDASASTDDLVLGFNGTDQVDYSGGANPVNVDLVAGTATGNGNDLLLSIENALGTGFDDTLTGDANDNELMGGAGADTIDGAKGMDMLFGNAGDDTLSGGDNDDTLEGGADNDELDGGLGDDSLEGNGGDDVLLGSDGDDTLDGGGGTNDTADYSNLVIGGMNGIVADPTSVNKPGPDADMLSGIENITGTNKNDTIDGDGNDNILIGGDGDDVLDGLLGDDTLFGGDDDDQITPDLGADSMDGGLGDDNFFYNASAEVQGTDVIDNFDAGGGADQDVIDLDGLFDDLGVAVPGRAARVLLDEVSPDVWEISIDLDNDTMFDASELLVTVNTLDSDPLTIGSDVIVS